MRSPPTLQNKLAAAISRLPFFYGWVVVAIAFVTMAVGVNARTAFSLLMPPILDEFGWSRGTIAATFSFGFIVSTILTPLIGVLMDRFGPRIVVPMGAIFMSIGLGGATFATEPWHFYATLGVLVGGGSIFMSYIGHTLFLPNWFDRRRGLAIGIAFSGVGVGSMIMFPWMQSSIQADGWRQSAWIIAVVILVIVAPLNMLFQRNRPEDMGLAPDGDSTEKNEAAENGPDDPERRIVDHDWVATEWTLGLAVRRARFWWLMASFVSALYAWYAVQVHQTRYLIDVGMTAESAAIALGLVGLTGIAGQIAIGHFSDRVGREWAWTASLMGFMAAYGCLLILRDYPSEWLMYVMVGTQGFLGYGLASVFGAVPAELFAGKHYGRIFGILGGAASLGGALGPYATGVLHDVNGAYDQAFAIAIAVSALSIATMWLAGPRKVRLVAGRARH